MTLKEIVETLRELGHARRKRAWLAARERVIREIVRREMKSPPTKGGSSVKDGLDATS